jgi:hypothetical protein
MTWGDADKGNSVARNYTLMKRKDGDRRIRHGESDLNTVARHYEQAARRRAT